jgi:uncharacterized phage-like protein YoqJ
MNYIEKVCSFTGYRTQKLNACLAKSGIGTAQLQEFLQKHMSDMLDCGFMTFMCGMAIGSDLMFAQAALSLRKQYLSLVRFVAVLPCLSHDKNWRESDRALCREILAQADEVVLVSEQQYFDGCMAKRNRYLVDKCDELLAVYDGQYGGTMQTINYAKDKRKRVTIIDPGKNLKVTLRETYQ